MTRHEDAHQGRRLALVGVAVLVVLSGATAGHPGPRGAVATEVGAVTLVCPSGRGLAPTCRVLIHTPIR